MNITLITAVRNGAATIADTLISVSRQRHAQVEHIVIDGGSTDATLRLVDVHGARVRTVVSEPDSGIYEAFNKGLRRASGEVIGFLNADDYYPDEDVLTRIATAFADPDVEAVFGDAAFVHPHDLRRVVRWYSSASFTPARIRYGLMPAHPTLFVRRAVYDRLGAFDTSYRIAGDFEFIVRAFGRARIRYAYLEALLVVMRTGGVSTRGLASKQQISREIVRACRQHGLATSRAIASVRYAFKLGDLFRGRTLLLPAAPGEGVR
jgi:glycosyltransferase involved in cell wall biosynthesis